jgi:hypothetical protein
MLARAEGLVSDRSNTRRLGSYRPYDKQTEFHAAGLSHRERLFLAGNHLGYTGGRTFEKWKGVTK